MFAANRQMADHKNDFQLIEKDALLLMERARKLGLSTVLELMELVLAEIREKPQE
jgi:hypothetical protein